MLNDIPEEEIEFQGKLRTSIHCENCGYETGIMDFKSAIFKVSMHGGYFVYDGEGGSEGRCPVCEIDTLNTVD